MNWTVAVLILLLWPDRPPGINGWRERYRPYWPGLLWEWAPRILEGLKKGVVKVWNDKGKDAANSGANEGGPTEGSSPTP